MRSRHPSHTGTGVEDLDAELQLLKGAASSEVARL